ncbi:MAG: magnesium/cobalt transporter CorA [Methanomicrobiaceae archaeon]|nr:magnesium/cobalt transporter CorA [Methanomicrobiaceae archaeon]
MGWLVDTQRNKSSSMIGLPPGALIHIGEKKTDITAISVIVYDNENWEEHEHAELEDMYAYAAQPGITWVNVTGLAETEIIGAIGEHFNLHPLTQEDILNTSQRPKLEDYEDYLFIVIKMLTLDEVAFSAEQVSIVLARDLVISFQEQPGDVFENVRSRIKQGKGRVRKAGADYLAYALLDAVVDFYFEIFESLGQRLETLEEALINDPNPETLEGIYSVKRDLIYLRKSVWPLREVAAKFERGESPLVSDSSLVYIKDLYDHIIQVGDTLETYREMVGGMLDIYLSSVSNRMNEVMKILTMIATIFIPLTFIAGIYGMNFEHMPELSWSWSYPLVILAMFVVALIMVMFFRKKGWL